MARLFDDAQSEYLTHAAAVRTATPFAFVCWFNSDDATIKQTLMAIGDADNDDNYFALTLRGDQAGDYLLAHLAQAGVGTGAYTTSGYSVDTWHHACAIFVSSTDRRALIDGGSKGTDVANRTPVAGNLDTTSVGTLDRLNDYGYTSGKIAEAAIYDLSAYPGATDSLKANYFEANVLPGLVAGEPPTTYTTGLVAYWPLETSSLDDEVDGYDLTASGTTFSYDHPSVWRNLGGVIATQSALTADIRVTEKLVGSVGATSVVVASLNEIAELAGLIEAQSSVTGFLNIANLLKITVSGNGSLIIQPISDNTNNLGHLMTSPVVIIQPGWDQGCDQGSANIWNVVVPRMIDIYSGGEQKQNEPSPMDQNGFTGAGILRGHEIPWFEIAHLLPRMVQNIGNLVSEQTVKCELYNADRTNAITVNSITNNLGDGFVVEGVPSTPFNIATQDSLSFTIRVLQSGDLIIDGEYILTLSTGEEYTILIIGSRIVLLPLRPEAPLREHLVWETKILPSIDAGEQRIANRATPRGVFEFTLKEGRKKVETILFDRQSKLLAVPAWHEPSFLTSAGSINDYTIYVDNTAYGNFYVGGYVIVFTDEYTFDALKIASMTATSITFDSPLAANHAKDTQVMPLMSAFAEATTPMVKAVYNDQDIQLKLLVHATPNDISDTSAWNSYNSKVFMDDPNYTPSRQIREAFRTKIYVLDNLYGDRGQFAQQIRALRHSQKGFKTNSRQELWELRQLLHALKGRQVSFYIPTFSKDLVPNQTLIQSNSTFTMDNIGYTLNVDKRWPRQIFRLHLKNGTILTRTIVGSSELSSSMEQLTVDTVWPYDILVTDIERVEFLEKVRFDTDDIMIIHYNALGVTECVVPTVEVTDDDI